MFIQDTVYSESLIPINHETIRGLLNLSSPNDLAKLFQYADQAKCHVVGSQIYLRGIIEFSNICNKNCYYCGIRKDNSTVTRFQMPEEEIVDITLQAYGDGIGSILLQSGERCDNEFTAMVERVVRGIKAGSQGRIGITLSLGEQDRKTYRRWFEAGAHRYLLRIETSNQRLYEQVHPKDHDFHVRIQCLRILRELGYQVGSGVLIGMPGQTTDDLAEDALFFRKIDLDMIGMGPYVIHSRTPLAKMAGNYNRDRQLNLGLKMIAVCRLLMPDINIAATTALQTLSSTGWARGIQAGANVVMPNLTPQKYRTDYNLYEGKTQNKESTAPLEYLRNLFNNIKEDIIPNRWGDSPHFKKRMSNSLRSVNLSA